MSPLAWRKKWLWDKDYIWELVLTRDASLVLGPHGRLILITQATIEEIPVSPVIDEVVSRYPSAAEWREWYEHQPGNEEGML